MEILEQALPDKLSDLIELALKDLELVEKDPRYRVDMSQWHYGAEKVCVVCLAGAVIAKTLGAPRNKTYTPGKCSSDNRVKLRALDMVRCGYLNDAVRYVHGGVPQASRIPHFVHVTGYDEDPTRFKIAMRSWAKYFKEMNL
jgi:hypothetical protein